MATHTTFAQRLLVAGGFAVAIAAAPVVAYTAQVAPSSPALANCPSTEVLDPNTGACKPFTDQAPKTMNPIDPSVTNLAPNALTESNAGDTGRLPEVNGIPCNGSNTDICIGLQENSPTANPGGAKIPVPPA